MDDKKRYPEDINNPEVVIYKMTWWEAFDQKVWPLIEKCREITARIQSWARKKPGGGWERIEPILSEDIEELGRIRKELEKFSRQWGRGWKNILNDSSRNDKNVGHGKDSNVFSFKNRPKYVYKESVLNKEKGQNATPENLIYLRRKYDILKMYLGDIVPRSRFVLWEVQDETLIVKSVPKVDIPRLSVITLQKRVNGENLQKMSKEKKQNPILLEKLEQAHKKYILLKMFIRIISEELWLSPDTFDVKMDIGPLSDIDKFDTQDPTSIRRNLTSPNIMFDGENVHFVDLDFGTWDTNKQTLYEYLMDPATVERWDGIMGNMWLTEK